MTAWLVVHYRNRARRAEAEAREVREAYANAIDALKREKRAHASTPTLQAALVRVEAADAREAALFEKVRQLEEYAAQVELERDDARRENDDVRAALAWLERDFKVSG